MGRTTEPHGGTHIDVLIVGAGISGIGAAYHLQTQLPGRTYAVVESKPTFGGTWHTHTYPGARSDSDLYTFGYRFKPWVGPPIATAAEILAYMGEVIDENDLAKHIHYHHVVTNAAWSSESATWTITCTDNTRRGETRTFTCNFLWMCQGYYNHAKGYTPEWPGFDSYTGTVVHPQTWPADLDVTDQRVVVIGSGATSATLVPAIADAVQHVTVLQRSPTFYWAERNAIEIADTLRQLEVDESWIHEIVRRKVLFDQGAMTALCQEHPELAAAGLIDAVAARLPEGFDVATHFTPTYRPWQQRIAVVPNGDYFAAISSGKASVVTDTIDTFTPTGIRTTGGTELDADIVVTATGFDMSVLGDIPFSVDGRPVDFSATVTYRGMMFTGIPNMAWVFGYFRASWTLRADLIADFVCRLLRHMDDRNASVATPELRDIDADMPIVSWISPDNFNPNYILRSIDALPRRGEKPEWQHTQDYWTEKDILPAADLDDGCLRFSSPERDG